MADLSVPPLGQTQTGFAVIVDNTGPVPVDMTSSNHAGGIVGVAEQSDIVRYTWSQPIDPESLVPGWDGGSPTTVTVRISNNGNNDRMRIRDVNNNNLNFGVVQLEQNYVAGTRTFTGSAITMVGNTVTIVLGVPSGVVNTVVAPTPTTWQAATGAYDAAGNACSNATITGSGSPRIDF